MIGKAVHQFKATAQPLNNSCFLVKASLWEVSSVNYLANLANLYNYIQVPEFKSNVAIDAKDLASRSVVSNSQYNLYFNLLSGASMYGRTFKQWFCATESYRGVSRTGRACTPTAWNTKQDCSIPSLVNLPLYNMPATWIAGRKRVLYTDAEWKRNNTFHFIHR